MLSLFKPKPKPPATLKERVKAFWIWYREVAPRFFREIDEKRCPQLHPEVSAKVDELFKGFAWEFGPGEEKGMHAFTLSGGGNQHRQFITKYWHSQAPKLPGWSFYPCLQPCDIKQHSLEVDDRKFEAIEFWITPVVNPDKKVFDVTLWHPLFDVLSEQHRWNITFLFLDQLLGEYGTGQWVGKIDLGDNKLAESIPLHEFPALIRETKTRNGWEKYPPGTAYTVYKSTPHDDFPRGDIVTGTTSNVKLVNDYGGAQGEMEDPLAETGADYIYIEFDTGFLPKGNEADARGEIEEALETALSAEASGYVFGGAYGVERSYIDLMIFDNGASLKIVKDVLRKRQLPSGTSINYFAKGKLGQRVVL